MSRTLIYNKNFEYIGQEIESMDMCKWLIDDICCNDKSDYLGDYPYPREICGCAGRCHYFEKEVGIIEEENK